MTTIDSDTKTTEQLPAMPDDDGVDRELIHGVLQERETTRRGQNHTLSGANITAALKVWLSSRPKPGEKPILLNTGDHLDRGNELARLKLPADSVFED